MRKMLLGLISLCVVASAEMPSLAAEKDDAGMFLRARNAGRGVFVLLGDKDCRAALTLAADNRLTVYVQLRSVKDVAAARRAVAAAGLYGTRICVEKGEPERVHLADNIADWLVAMGDSAGVPADEVLRVLRPGGTALVRQKELVKPMPEGVDDWGHHYHGPDNNPQSKDRLARAPYLTQFIAEPRYAACPQNAVASAGRIFMAFGHVAWHQREERTLNTLFAMNGFNGAVLWKRRLKSGIMVDRSTMIATPTTLYLADDQSCKLINPATGVVRDEIVAPAKPAGGTFWKWMALEDGVLYALIGEGEPQDPVARWRRTGHGWPWGGISKGYNRGPYAWGFANALFAIDPKTKKVLWHHQEEQQIDSRGLCIKNGRIFLCSFGKYLACLDAKDGKEVWRRTAEKDADLFKTIGPYRPGHGYIGGWKSTVYLKCTDKALYFIGPQVNCLTALSATDGTFLWKYPRKDLHVVIRDDGLYTTGPQNSRGHTKKLDPMTGKVLATYPVSRRACTRSVGTADSILFRASGGSVRLDLTTGRSQLISPMRPPCQIGVVVANGHLYWLPWVCDCNLQMFGLICCGPAGGYQFDRKATETERLESPAADPANVAAFQVSPDDWPTYRADNARTAETQAVIPDTVGLLWQSKPKVRFEPSAPVVAGGVAFVSGSDGIVRAFDAATGAAKWTAYTGGAVRYPPAIAGGRALVGSGDGWAYAFEAATGRLLWRFRAAPIERKIPVYGSLLSTWPVASGVLVESGVAYFAAGINNYDGTHVYALDATNGKIKWQNNTSGFPVGGSRSGVGVQGDLLLHNGKLYLAGGNAVSPGAYDVKDGKCHTPLARGVASRSRRGRELRLANGAVTVSGQPLYSRPGVPVFSREVRWTAADVMTKNAKLSWERTPGGERVVWKLVAQSRTNKQRLWAQPLPAPPVRWGMAVDAQGRIVVTLWSGEVLCFGKKAG